MSEAMEHEALFEKLQKARRLYLALGAQNTYHLDGKEAADLDFRFRMAERDLHDAELKYTDAIERFRAQRQ